MSNLGYGKKKLLPFVKGHMGGNEIILLDGHQVPKGKEIEYAVSTLESPNVRGHQAGLIYELKGQNQIKAKIVDVTDKDFISICGGLTQVLGKALVETDFADRFDIRIKEPVTKVFLETDAGIAPLEIENNEGITRRTRTTMNSFIEECYKLGIESVKSEGVKAIRVGEALVVNEKEIKEKYPEANFEEMDEFTLKILREIQSCFVDKVYSEKREELKEKYSNANEETKGCTFSLYDLNPELNGDARVIFPHYIPTGHIEPTCGTGTVAVGIAMLKKGEIKGRDGEFELLFESGGDTNSIGGPDLTRLKLAINNGKVTDAHFSHSLVEILATGRVWV